jgi:hypothetical protein
MKHAKVSITEDKVMADLEEVRRAALEAGAFAPAIRCIELQGKHIGLWPGRTDPPSVSLLDLIGAIAIDDKQEDA